MEDRNKGMFHRICMVTVTIASLGCIHEIVKKAYTNPKNKRMQANNTPNLRLISCAPYYCGWVSGAISVYIKVSLLSGGNFICTTGYMLQE